VSLEENDQMLRSGFSGQRCKDQNLKFVKVGHEVGTSALLPKHQTVEGDVVVGDEATGIGRRPCHPGGKLGDQNLKLIKVDLEAPGPANSGRFQRSLWMPEPTNFFGGTKVNQQLCRDSPSDSRISASELGR